MFIVEDVWKLIKEYLFHDIKKQGKHLKNDKNIHKYNYILKTLPKMYMFMYILFIRKDLQV